MAPSLDPLLRPRTIAVIGATSRKESLGGKITARLFDAVTDPLLGRLSDWLFARSPRAVLGVGVLSCAVLACAA